MLHRPIWSAREPLGLTREQLYEAVWSEPMERFARRFGLSDVALAKRCKALDVPVPGRGYWQRLKAGVPAVRTPLPPAPAGHRPDRLVILYSTDRGEVPRRWKVTVRNKPTDPHPVAVEIRERLRQGGKSLPATPDVRRQQVGRLVSLFDAIGNAVEERGYRVWLDPSGNAFFGDDRDAIRFSISGDDATSSLAIQHFGTSKGRRKWSDGKAKSVEKQLGMFLALIEQALIHHRDERLHAEAKARRLQISVDRQRLAEEDKAMAARIIATMRRWEEAEGLRRFADALSAAADLPDQMADAAAAARRYADQIDPMIKDKPARFRTCDYMEYEEWYGNLCGILGDIPIAPDWARRAYQERMTPEEAAIEIEW